MNVRELKKMRASAEAWWSSNESNIFNVIAHNLGTSTIKSWYLNYYRETVQRG